jgi:hypothetical protein
MGRFYLAVHPLEAAKDMKKQDANENRSSSTVCAPMTPTARDSTHEESEPSVKGKKDKLVKQASRTGAAEVHEGSQVAALSDKKRKHSKDMSISISSPTVADP